jgi:serine phosphatase RsbU (regulator of sigma subunit)
MLHSAQTAAPAWRDDYWIPTGSAVNGFSVSAACRPAFDVGGDFYAVLRAEEQQLAVLIGDACGKGARAARIAALVRGELPDLARSFQGPAALLDQLNARLCGELADDAFATAACFELSAADRTLTVANAGHIPLFVLRASSGRVFRVGTPSGPPLGMVRGVRYSKERTLVSPEDLVVLVTDGVLEALDDDPLGGRLAELVANAPPDAELVKALVLDEVARGSRASGDDLSVMCVSVPFGAAKQTHHRVPRVFAA